MNATTAIRRVIEAEGGSQITNFSNDPGGLTKYGISQKAYPSLDIRNLTESQAIAIYKRDYWDRVQGDSLPYNVAYSIFNYAVNRGVSVAVKYAQKVVGQVEDGIMGSKTILAIVQKGERSFLEDYLALAKKGYADLVARNPALEDFKKGWDNRIKHISDYVGVKPSTALGGLAVVITLGIIFFITFSQSKSA